MIDKERLSYCMSDREVSDTSQLVKQRVLVIKGTSKNQIHGIIY